MGKDRSLWYGLTFFVNQKWKNEICKLRKADDRILILQLASQEQNTKRKLRYESRKVFLNHTHVWTEK